MFNCHYNQNKGYVVFSAMGSFFIPMTVMLYVYLKIFYVLMSRQHRMTKTEVNYFIFNTALFSLYVFCFVLFLPKEIIRITQE